MPFTYVDAIEVEDRVWGILFDPEKGPFVAERMDNLRQAVAKTFDDPVSEDDITKAREEVARIEAALENADADLLIADSERRRKATRRLAERLEGAERHLAALEVAYGDVAGRAEQWSAYEEAARRVSELAANTDPAERKKVLDMLDITVTLVPTRSEPDGSHDGYTLALNGLLNPFLITNLSTGWWRRTCSRSTTTGGR